MGRFLVILAVFAFSSIVQGKHWVLGCVDCYSSASLYASEIGPLLPPGDTVEWVLIRTHQLYPSHEATLRAFPETSLRLEWPGGEAERKGRVLAELRSRRVDHVLGGMDEGQYFACELNDALGFRDNPLTSRDARKKKLAMSEAVGGEYGIPTRPLTSLPAALDFIDSFPQREVTIKFDAGAGAVGLEFVSKHDRAALIRRLEERLRGDHTGFAFREDRLVLQPRILAREFFADTYTMDGKTFLTGLWEYYKVRIGEYLVYFVDRALELDSAVALELGPVLSEIARRVELVEGPGHIEMFRETGTGRWYLVEVNARVAGGGIPTVEKSVWGLNHLQLYLLSILDRERLARELATFPRKKRTDAINFIVPSPGHGNIVASEMTRLRALPTRVSYGPQFESAADKIVVPTVNLMTSAFMTSFVGTTSDIRADFSAAFDSLTSGRLIAHGGAGCATTLAADAAFFAPFAERVREIAW